MRVACVGPLPPGAFGERLAATGRDLVRLEGADDALRHPADHAPDAWVAPALLRGLSGFELARRLSARDGAAPVLILTGLDGVWPLARAIRAGARGYLQASGSPALLDEALVSLVAGRPFWKTPERSPEDAQLREAGVEELSPRLFEALHLVLQGADDAGVAQAMTISPRSAAAYRRELARLIRLSVPGDLERLGRLMCERFYLGEDPGV